MREKQYFNLLSEMMYDEYDHFELFESDYFKKGLDFEYKLNYLLDKFNINDIRNGINWYKNIDLLYIFLIRNKLLRIFVDNGKIFDYLYDRHIDTLFFSMNASASNMLTDKEIEKIKLEINKIK